MDCWLTSPAVAWSMKRRSSRHWRRAAWVEKAGLDVFADEPRVPEALWSMEQVVLQPHRASATLETRADMGDVLVANLTAHFAGQIPPAAVA